MTRNTAIRLLLLQTALMILLGWATVYLGRDEFRLFSGREEEEVPTASHVEDEGGMPVVQLSSAAIREVGIEYAKASATELAPQSTVGVTVLDPQPLVELRGRLQAAALDLQAAQAAANASRAEESRVRALFEDDRNASQRAAQQAAAQAQADAARRQSAEAALESLRAQARTAWGTTIAGWLDGADATGIDRLASGKDCLLRAAVRPEDIAGAPGLLRISVPGRAKPVATVAVGPAPQADAQLGGSGLLYRVSAPELRPGMRLSGSLSRGHRLREGALVPSAAIVWHTGKPWIYLREADEKKEDASEFRRRDVSGGEAIGDDWFVTGLEEDAEIVVRGAQVLLSEELKFQIKNENDD
ncbi:MAG TPA: hypothetical protein PLX20_10665 [Rhodocyclaceae bacterium]|nr:hypothetical protein [Rhodocyclaceae bacterium]HNC61148.1 hypothetical protein [Rhodocyclaceae bacterium]HNH13589.1 hypothetical protein [Rhodocyclaceae bacterium]